MKNKKQTKTLKRWITITEEQYDEMLSALNQKDIRLVDTSVRIEFIESLRETLGCGQGESILRVAQEVANSLNSANEKLKQMIAEKENWAKEYITEINALKQCQSDSNNEILNLKNQLKNLKELKYFVTRHTGPPPGAIATDGPHAVFKYQEDANTWEQQ